MIWNEWDKVGWGWVEMSIKSYVVASGKCQRFDFLDIVWKIFAVIMKIRLTPNEWPCAYFQLFYNKDVEKDSLPNRLMSDVMEQVFRSIWTKTLVFHSHLNVFETFLEEKAPHFDGYRWNQVHVLLWMSCDRKSDFFRHVLELLHVLGSSSNLYKLARIRFDSLFLRLDYD